MGNVPPGSGIRVPPDEMRRLVQALFASAGMLPAGAGTMAELLVHTDLRGVFSHGTQQVPGYCRMLRDGEGNPTPQVRVTRQTTTTQTLDGDGGMGHLPCKQGTEWAVECALEHGTGAVTTRNHFHFGSAGKYTHIAAARGCIGIAFSSHRYHPQNFVRGVLGASPLSVALPAGEQPPVILDMASSMLEYDEELFARMPFAFFKELGVAAIPYGLGGVLAGIYSPELIPPESRWISNQGSFIAAFSIEAFMDVGEYQAEMDRWVSEVRALEPFPGHEQAELPGGLEWQRERDYAENGISVSDHHRACLEEIAGELEVETRFKAYEQSRFEGGG